MGIRFDSIREGEELPVLTKPEITQLQLIKYAGASGDFNPIHTIPDKAREAGLDGTIAHGMLVMGILGQMLSAWAGPGKVLKFGVSFKAPTRPGDILSARGTVKRKYEEPGKKLLDCALRVEDSQGEVKVEGRATVLAE
ncbi:MAG: dehydratase [Spirochaetia bacterium]|jgi:acyl dehydratase|nr:dehydratase [Spirochaetia bacterium]